MTENIFPYELPKNWHWTTLENVAKWGAGGTPSRKIPEYYRGTISWIKTGELNDGYIFQSEEHITAEAVKNSSAKIFPKNSVVIAMYGATIGKVGILGIESSMNQACACAVCEKNIYFKFLFHYLISQKENFVGKAKGGAQPNISQEIIKKFLIPLPPIGEQKKIVKRIESLFSKLDSARSIVQKILDGYELRRAAILHKAFTGELSKNFRAKNNLSLDDWQEVTMADIFILKAGKNISATEISPVKTFSHQYPCFGGNGIRGFVSNFNNEGNFPIIGRQGALCGNIKLASGKFYATEHAVVVTFKKEIESRLAENYLRYLNLNQYATATAQPGLAVKKILKMKIKYIPFAEQKEIVRVLDNLLDKEQRTKEIAEKILQEIDLLKKSVLARAFRGEL